MSPNTDTSMSWRTWRVSVWRGVAIESFEAGSSRKEKDGTEAEEVRAGWN